VAAILSLIPAQIVFEDRAHQEPYPSWYGPDFDAQRPTERGIVITRPVITAVYADGHSERVSRGDVLKGMYGQRRAAVFLKRFFDGLGDDARLYEPCRRVKPYQRGVPGCTRSGHRFLTDEGTLAYLRRNLPGVRTLRIRWEQFRVRAHQTDSPKASETLIEYEIRL
jgi:hypothetical protein